MTNKTKVIITSASNKFFPSLLNLLGSLKINYPNHPDIYIYNLGLLPTYRKELENIPKIHMMEVPHFVPHWRSCYTWKTYILNTPLADLNLYIDAGCQVLKPLDELFKKIEIQDYMAVSQGPEVSITDITPEEYLQKFELTDEQIRGDVITAGIFGFKKNSKISKLTELLYQCGIQELCLGFSANEQWKNKGVNKTHYIRDCKMFRHDTTVLTLLLHKLVKGLVIEPIEHFSGQNKENKVQYIWNLRLNYKKLEYTHPSILNSKPYKWYVLINRLFLMAFLIMKRTSNMVKSKIRKLRKS